VRGPNKGDMIVKLHSLRSYLLAFASALLIASCGGGGSSTTTDSGGPLTIGPDGATFFAGVRYTITITGGRTPYTLTSSEPSLLAVPNTFDGHTLDVVPNNPSVIDAGIAADELPVRTVNITVRSPADGATAVMAVKVARNFLTGYGFSFGSSTCTTIVKPCAGGDTVIAFDSTFAGNLLPNRTYRIERVRGPFTFIDPLNANNTSDSILVTSDASGRFTAIVRVSAGAPTQIAIMRVTDVATGSQAFENFVINGPANAGLTVLPASATLTGPNGSLCGFGAVDVLVFDGQPPYTALCASQQIAVNPASSNPTPGQPGRFTFTVGASPVCLNAEPCVIQDSTGARTTFTITTIKGQTVPPPALAVTPNAITLTCGASGNVTVTGGSGSYSANSTHPRVTATVSGNTVTITRLGAPDPAGGPFPTTATISITDGSTAVPVTATVPAAC
jgi:hypothetical protein